VRCAARFSRPHCQSRRRHGCPGRHEEGTRDIVQERAARLCSNASALGLLCPRPVERIARKPVRGGSRFAGLRCGDASWTNATGIGWCRRVAERKLHSRARIERSLGVPARRFQVAEVGKRHRGSEKRVSRWQRGAWTGTWLSRVRKDPGGRKGVESRNRGGQAARPGNSGAGRSKGRRGAKVLARWKVSRITRSARIVHAIGLMVVSAALTGARVARAT